MQIIGALTWMRVIVFLLYAVHASLAPFLSLALRELGWSISQTGILVSSSKLFSLLSTPIIATYANQSQTLNPVVVLAGLSGGVSLLLGVCGRKVTFASFFLMFSTFTICSSPKQTIIDNLVVRSCGSTNYGGVRLWGSISWGLTGFIMGGGMYLFEYEVGKFVFIIHGLVLIIFAFVISRTSIDDNENEEKASPIIIAESLLPPLPLYPPLILLFIFGVLEFSVDMVYFPYLRHQGASPILLSTLVATIAVVEVVGFSFSTWLHARMKISSVICLAGLAFAAKVIGYFLAGTSWLALIAQALHGLYFPLMWTASIHIIENYLESHKLSRTNMMVWMWVVHTGLPPVVSGILSAELEQNVGALALLKISSSISIFVSLSYGIISCSFYFIEVNCICNSIGFIQVCLSLFEELMSGQAEISPRDSKKGISKEKLAEMTERLTRISPQAAKRNQPLPPITSPRKMNSDEMGKSVDRLYTQPLHMKKMRTEKELETSKKKQSTIVLDDESLNSAIGRLYGAAETHKLKLDKLREKHDESTSKKLSPPKKMSREEQLNSGRRLHDESLMKSKEKQEKLLDKYIKSTEVKSSKLSAGEIEESAARLFSGAGPSK